jgi:hypothetical protein
MLPISRGLYGKCYPAIANNGFRALDPTRIANIWRQFTPVRFCMTIPRIPNAVVRFPSSKEIQKHLSAHKCTMSPYFQKRVNECIAFHFHNLKVEGKKIPSNITQVTSILAKSGMISVFEFSMVTTHVTHAMIDLATIGDEDESLPLYTCSTSKAPKANRFKSSEIEEKIEVNIKCNIDLDFLFDFREF